MKKINIQDMITKSGILKIMSSKFADRLGVPEEKLEIYLNKKLESNLDRLGKKMSNGDMTAEDFNMLRRLSDVNLSEINDKIIKDK